MNAPDVARRALPPLLTLVLVVSGTVLGLAGTDLVLPAIPSLPAALGGDVAGAQGVLAAYTGGTALGLLVFGALGDRFDTRTLFIGSLAGTALLSFACACVDCLNTLIALRALHGAVAAAPAVFAPGIVKSLFDERGAVRAIGALGSIEALAIAVAPLIGAWLLTIGDWRLSFRIIALLALSIAAAIGWRGHLPRLARRQAGSYARLLRDPVYLRYMLSQSLILGGLLVFVFGMPAVFVHAFGGTLRHFIIMQLCGIAGFMLATNLAGHFVHRFGAERFIVSGTVLAAAGAAALLLYAMAGGRSPVVITALFVPVNTGLGLRGPSGFFRALQASQGDDARGAALVILGMLATAAAGTALAASSVASGLVPLTATALTLHVLGCLSLLLPRLR